MPTLVLVLCVFFYFTFTAAYRAWRSQFLDGNDQLHPRYEPRPLEEVSTIATPKGPNELW